MTDDTNRCRWITLEQTLAEFVYPAGRTQTQAHIRPLHWYVSCRLVLEGGFLPDEITPRPPFVVEGDLGAPSLVYRPEAGGSGEQTVLGGLKTKDVDITVVKPRIGPCVAVSVKGTLNAFRNLTNRMEEAVGDCTNLHLSYPNLVYGFLHLLRANREGPRRDAERRLLRAGPDGNLRSNDLAIAKDGIIVESIRRYHEVLLGLSGRRGLRNDLTRYESLAVALVRTEPPAILTDWPSADSPLRFETFFDRLFDEYDRRYVFAAPRLSATTGRVVWSADSPAFSESMAEDYPVRRDG